MILSPLKPSLAAVAFVVVGLACTSPGVSIGAPTNPPAVAPSTVASPAAANVSRQLEDAAQEVDKAIAAAQGGDLAKAKSEFEEFDEDWDKIEDGVKAKSPDAYRTIEDAMDEVELALVKPAAPDKDTALSALRKLRQTIADQAPRLR